MIVGGNSFLESAMRTTTLRLGAFALAVLTVSAFGCGKESSDSKDAKPAVAERAGGRKIDDHSAWWCGEHGIPEDECSMCSAKVAKDLKAKGDWCDKHDRAKSQCFICDPSLKEKFAAKYRAKYGKEPPPIDEEKD